MAKKMILRYELNGQKKKKTVELPNRSIKAELSGKPSTYKNKVGKSVHGVKVKYLPSRKSNVKLRAKLVSLPKGVKNVKLVK